MKNIFFALILIINTSPLSAQTALKVKNVKTGNVRLLKAGKAIQFITMKDSIATEHHRVLDSISSDSIFVRDGSFAISEISTVSYKIDESTSAPVAMGWAAILCIVASPFTGITKDGYNIGRAAGTFGVGVGMFGVLAFATRNRHLRTYTIVGTK